MKQETGGCRAWRARLAPFAAAALVLAVGRARADEIRLSSGEVLTVRILGETDTAITFEHAVLGTVTLPKESVTILSREPAVEPPAQTPGTPPTGEAAPAAEQAPERPISFWDGWEGTVEGGLNGSDGNSENLSFRAGISAKRAVETMETSLSLFYTYDSSDGDASKSYGSFEARNDWLFKDSKWGFFALGRVEYDEFADWDWRLSGFLGPTYSFIKNDRTTLKGRAGVGGNYEIGGVDEEFEPEALIGADFTHKLTERQELFLSVEYLPSLTEFPAYRVDGRAGWSIMVDPETDMSLKLGVADRYDSSPGPDRKRNDIEYFATIAWDF